MDIVSVIKVVSIFAVLLVGAFSRVWKGKPDNSVEEEAEKIIFQETSLDIDLSPDSPEGRDGDSE